MKQRDKSIKNLAGKAGEKIKEMAAMQSGSGLMPYKRIRSRSLSSSLLPPRKRARSVRKRKVKKQKVVKTKKPRKKKTRKTKKKKAAPKRKTKPRKRKAKKVDTSAFLNKFLN